MVSMEIEPEERSETGIMPETCPQPLYPYGLTLCFNDQVLDKLKVDTSDWSVGDVFHLFAFARITSISENETTDGSKKRIELQITDLSGEDENSEEVEKQDMGFRPLG